MCPSDDQMMFTNAEGGQLTSNGTMCLKFIDTKQEKKIDLGVGWPYEALDPYQCIISSGFS